MRIAQLQIKNFKGIKSFVFEPNQDVTEIGAANGSGKSSIATAYQWVLNLVNDANVNPVINKKHSTKETSVKLDFANADGETYDIEKRTMGVFENGVKTANKSTYLINGAEVLKREYDKFIDTEFKHKGLLRYDLLESMKWEELRELIVVILGVQDKSDFKEEDLKKLVGAVGLAGAVKKLDAQAKAQTKKIDETAFKIAFCEELRGYGALNATSTIEKKLGELKKEQAKEFERLTKNSLIVEKAMISNEKRLETELKKMLGGNLEVVLRNELLNGNVKPTCSITHNGVEFDKLSYSQRTLAQLNLWHILFRRAGVFYPVFIDNFESVDLLTEKKVQSIIQDDQRILLSVDDFKIKGLELVSKEDL